MRAVVADVSDRSAADPELVDQQWIDLLHRVLPAAVLHGDFVAPFGLELRGIDVEPGRVEPTVTDQA